MKASKRRGRLRLAVQIVVFALFLFLLLGTRQEMTTGSLHSLFFQGDPLVGLAVMVAGRFVIPSMLIGGVFILAATLVFGRGWCGWLCPLGSLFDWMPARKSGRDQPWRSHWWRQGKNLALLMIVLAVFGRSFTVSTSGREPNRSSGFNFQV